MVPVDNLEWSTIESAYTSILKFAFRSLRREENNSIEYFHNTQINFQAFLARPDKEQVLVDLFQSEFNILEDDLRSDPDVKAELHQRCEDLRERLWELSDRRREETEAERLSIIEDRWVEDYSHVLVNIYITMLQAEVDRHQSTRQLLADYYQDVSEFALQDISHQTYKIPLVSSASAYPVDVSTHLIAAQNQSAIKLQSQKPGAKPAVSASSSGQKDNRKVDKNQAQQKVDIAPGKHVIPLTLEKDPINVDYENVSFPDIQAACDFVLSNVLNIEISSDQKKASKETKEAPKVEIYEEEKTEQQKANDADDKILLMRVERIKNKCIEHLKAFRSRAYRVFIDLDEKIGQRFSAEMKAVKDMVTIIKEVIEAEQKIPNKLFLFGEKFFVDFGSLMYEPEPEPRPVSPLEKQMSDQFTVLQISTMAKHLLVLAPNGTIASKAFVDFLLKTAVLSQSVELVPDNYIFSEAAQFHGLMYALDPFETGLINWKRFLMMHTKMLPMEFTDLQALVGRIRAVSTADSLTYQQFLDVEVINVQPVEDGMINRAAKLTSCVFDLFQHRRKQISQEPLFDINAFLLTCCIDATPSSALQKAWAAMASPIGKCSEKAAHDILHFNLGHLEIDHRTLESQDPYPATMIRPIFGEDKELDFDTFWNRSLEANAAWLECPLFQAHVISISHRTKPCQQQRHDQGLA